LEIRLRGRTRSHKAHGGAQGNWDTHDVEKIRQEVQPVNRAPFLWAAYAPKHR